ncbi:MAG TPA: diguanylate cyclase [Anaerolineales bacterium]|nr:diguanylate cyclase [Anaerolineales bacterium]
MASNLKTQNERLSALYSIALDLLHRQSLEDVLKTILSSASELLDSPIGFLDLIDGEMLIIQAATPMVSNYLGMRVPIHKAAVTERAIQTRSPQFIKNYMKRRSRIKEYDPFQMMSACTFPIMVGETVVGALSLGRVYPGKPYNAKDVETIRAFSELAAIALERANAFEETLRHSLTDGLTSLANRRHFDARLTQEWDAALRDARPVALLLVDVDRFKKYNDANGHLKGDECLRQIAEVLMPVGRRQYDLAARYGGEEFALILPGSTAKNAAKRAETLRKKMLALKIPHRGSPDKYVTVSIGVAALTPTPSTQPADLVARADQALYDAKKQGRNRVVVFKG